MAGDALLDDIMYVMEAAFDPAYGEAWNRRQVADALAMPTTHALVVDSAGELIFHDSARDTRREAAGFVLTRAASGDEELLLIGVAPRHRRNGLGERLIEHLFAHSANRNVEQIFLEMRRGNPAIHLYQKLGFRPIGQRHNYYRLANGSRVDAITFSRVVLNNPA